MMLLQTVRYCSVLFGTMSVLRKREREGKEKEREREERCRPVLFGAVRRCLVLSGAVLCCSVLFGGLLDNVRCCPVPFGAERERGSERQRGAGDPSEVAGARESDEAARGGRRG